MDVTRREVKDGDLTLVADMRKRAVRIHHPTLKSCVYTIVSYRIRYPIPHDCPLCMVGHIFKTYHLLLNENGDVTVAAPIYENWKQEGIVGEMRATKEVVPKPWVLRLPTVDVRVRKEGEVLPPLPFVPAAPPPPVIMSREDGIVKAPNMQTNRPSPERITSG